MNTTVDTNIVPLISSKLSILEQPLNTLLNIEDNDEVENDAGEEYVRIYDEEECNIDDIEPTEPEQDKAPEVPVQPTENTEPEQDKATTEPSKEV
jgi:hypothetical protein